MKMLKVNRERERGRERETVAMHSIVSQRIQQGLPTTIFFLLFVANTTLPTYNSIVKSTVGQIDEVATLKKRK